MLPEVVNGSIDAGEAYEFKTRVNVGGCYIIQVDYKVSKISLNLKMAQGPMPWWHEV